MSQLPDSGAGLPSSHARTGHRHGTRPLPRWLALIFLAGCLGIIPQIISLSSTLSEVQLANNWRTVWVGLDIAESAVFLLTAWFLYRRSRLVSITASIAFAMLWLDAWFDVMTAVGAGEIALSRTLAVFVELPLGVFCLLVALRPLGVLHRPAWLARWLGGTRKKR
jgi:hypothetical protein